MNCCVLGKKEHYGRNRPTSIFLLNKARHKFSAKASRGQTEKQFVNKRLMKPDNLKRYLYKKVSYQEGFLENWEEENRIRKGERQRTKTIHLLQYITDWITACCSLSYTALPVWACKFFPLFCSFVLLHGQWSNRLRSRLRQCLW